MPQLTKSAPAAGVRGRAGVTAVGVASLLAIALVVILQLVHLPELLDLEQPRTAGYAKALVLGYALVVVALAGSAAFLPTRLLWLPVMSACAVAVAALFVTLVFGGQLGSLLAALATMAAAWQVGRWVLQALGASSLHDAPPVAWLTGAGVLGLAILFLGRAGLLSVWVTGAPVLALGTVGVWNAARMVGRSGLRQAWTAVTSTRLAAASAAICVLVGGVVSVWTAAPEVMFDALYYKAWLPERWTATGQIDPEFLHPVVNFFGTAQLLAVPGHHVSASAVGRYLQWLAFLALPATVWWSARRTVWAPALAAAVAITPALFWQASTAYDDVLLALVGAAAALGVIRLLDSREMSPLVGGLALGVLLAASVNFKQHLAPLAAGLAIGWLLMRGRRGWVPALSGLVVGGLLVAAPPLILRWIDLGNPVLPSYNNIFQSPYWPSEHTTFNFPKLRDPGALGPISTLWLTLVEPYSMEGWAPPGAFGVLTLAIAITLVMGWPTRARPRAVVALWLGVLLGFASWYLQFRNVRYLLPTGMVAMLTMGLLLQARGSTARTRTPAAPSRLALVGVACAAALLWPATVAQFWNVPGRDVPWEAAIGLTDEREYTRLSTPNREALEAFDRLAPPGALAVADPHERAWLTDGRDLTPLWELDFRLRAQGPLPAGPAETLSRMRRAGVTWAIISSNGSIAAYTYLDRMLTEIGEERWSSPTATIYRLPPG